MKQFTTQDQHGFIITHIAANGIAAIQAHFLHFSNINPGSKVKVVKSNPNIPVCCDKLCNLIGETCFKKG